jgi:hypothetical protein
MVIVACVSVCVCRALLVMNRQDALCFFFLILDVGLSTFLNLFFCKTTKLDIPNGNLILLIILGEVKHRQHSRMYQCRHCMLITITKGTCTICCKT